MLGKSSGKSAIIIVILFAWATAAHPRKLGSPLERVAATYFPILSNYADCTALRKECSCVLISGVKVDDAVSRKLYSNVSSFSFRFYGKQWKAIGQSIQETLFLFADAREPLQRQLKRR